MLARLLITGSAAIVLALGVIHLVYTFRGTKLTPRDPSLQERMKEVSPIVTRETTMWRVWVGVNATHSLALLLFGLVYGYLALARGEVLFESLFLQVLGAAMLLGFVVLARLYFFSVPFWSLCGSLLCYVSGLVLGRLNHS
jgi:hypothetical protein